MRSRLITADSIPARSGKIRRSASAKSRDWERAAMVTDVEWMRHAAKFFGGFFGFLVSGEWRAFPTADADKAREWVVGGGPAARM